MRVVSTLSLPFLLAFVIGCGGGHATVSYDSSSNRTAYGTRSYTVSTISGTNFASSKEITMRAFARCQGARCTPNQVQLIFSAAGNQELSLSGVNGELMADGSSITWTSAEASSGLGSIAENQVLRVSGKFAVVHLQLDQLDTLATAGTVEGSIGGQALDIGSGVQAGLQDLLRKIPQGQ